MSTYFRDTTLNIVVASLLKDLATLKDRHQIQPDLVFFTGDLISRGENGKTEFDLARRHFIIPLLKLLNLGENRFSLVPGNHEVDRTKVSDTFEKGLSAKLTDQDSFNSYYHDLKPDAEDSKIIRRKFHLFHAFSRKLRSDAVDSTSFYDAYRMSIKGLNLGILGFNTAWRSSNIGPDEKRLILGEAVFFDALQNIQNCDLKIGLSHHGLDMLTLWDSRSIKLAMAKNLDVLCTGHIHDSEFSYVQQIFGNLYVSTCGSLFPGRIRNGYSLVEIDLTNRKLSVFLRRWYDSRKEFDQETEKCTDGLVVFEGFKCSNSLANELIEINSIRHKVATALIPADIIYPFDGINQVQLQDVFVEPLMSDRPSFAKDVKERKYYKLEEILGLDSNIVFYSRKECGKTVLLKYIQSEMLHSEERFEGKLPVFIKFGELPKNNPDSISRIVRAAFEGNISDEMATRYLETGRFVLLIDDFDDYSDDSREKRKDTFFKIFQSYPNCRFILSMNEKLSHSYQQESVLLSSKLNAASYYLCSFNTARIRRLLEKWCHYENFDVDRMLSQIVFYFRHLQIPVTPMAITLFIGILVRDRAKKNLNNEAYLIENYLETILEKLGQGLPRGQMDFRDKESFLSHIAYRMQVKDTYEWTRTEFEKEKIEYFENYDEDLPDSKIFDDFFKKGILQESNQMISFKFRFWFNFFLAKAMQKDPKKKQEILNSPKYLKYASALAYKAGLDRNDKDLLMEIDNRSQVRLRDYFEKHRDKLIQDYPIETGLIETGQDIEDEIRRKNNPSMKDEALDTKYLAYDEDDQSMEQSAEFDDIIQLITLHSDVIRNTSEVETILKTTCIGNNVGIYVGLMWEAVEVFKEIIKGAEKTQLKDLVFLKEKEDGGDIETEKIIERVERIVFQIIPVSVIEYMSEHLANPKLKRPVKSLLHKEEHLGRRLFYSLLLLTLDLETGITECRNLIHEPGSYIVDQIIFIYAIIFCFEHKLEDETLNRILDLLDKIREKHSKIVKRDAKEIPRFMRNTFRSDIRKSILMKAMKKAGT